MRNKFSIEYFSIFQIEEVKTKETYSVAKSLLEKYGETVTPDVRPSVSTPENASKGMLRNKGKDTFN